MRKNHSLGTGAEGAPPAPKFGGNVPLHRVAAGRQETSPAPPELGAGGAFLRIGTFLLLFWGVSHVLEWAGRVLPLSALGDLSEESKAFAALLSFWIMTRFVDKRTMAEAGFAPRGVLKETLAGFVGGGILLSMLFGLMALCGVYRVVGRGDSLLPLLPLWSFLVVAVLEETVFRGYVLQTLERAWGRTAAIVGSGLLFGMAHLWNPVVGVTFWERLAGPFGVALESVLLSAAYLKTRRLWLPIGIHWAWNYCESSVFGVPDSGQWASDTVVRARLIGPFWATGGPFGPEAGVFFMVGMTLAGLCLLRRAPAVPDRE